MGFDAWFLSAVLGEIREKTLGGRVEKIHQPARDTVILHLRCPGGREKLLLAPNPAAPRLHLTGVSLENPDQPPMFCMLLRKHLLGARLLRVEQPPMERAAEFVFDCLDELGDPVEKRLTVELMGRTCNLYLVGPDGRIVDCLRRVGLEDSARRQALPGLYYQPPAPVDRPNPAAMTAADFARLLEAPGPDRLADRLQAALGGLSPLVCREAALFAAGDPEARPREAGAIPERLELFFREHLTHPAPWYFPQDPKYYSYCPLRQYGECVRASSFGALMDLVTQPGDRRNAQKTQALRKTLGNLCQRLTRKLALQEKELTATYGRERLRQLGDIVTANLSRIERGQRVLRAEDFYDEAMGEIEIPLSPQLSPQQNAAKFYKDYARQKNAEKELTRQMALAREELGYLHSVLEELDRAETDRELEEIRQELREQGYLRQETDRKRIKRPPSAPLQFTSTDGYPIYVGRNNRQNDQLTFRMARKDDLWLHAQKVPGSHVVIACAGVQPPDRTVTQAAQLAAYYAQTRQGQNVPVDVTPVKQVKKPNAARPGMVVYYTYRTVYVNPKGEIEP